MATSEKPIRLAAVGDVLLSCRDNDGDESAARAATAMGGLFDDCDVVFGNLECALRAEGQTVPTEPRVTASEAWVRAVAGQFDVVCLANNHAFDCLEGGFRGLRRLLEDMRIAWFGAGDDLEQAVQPAVIERRGVSLAFLGAADTRSGPFRFAAPGQWGVAPLDIDRLERQVRQWRGRVHHVIVSLHWGEERFLIPSPVQVEQARRLAEAGAAMVLGHHPHVIQGMHYRHGAPIIYSLGNFFARDIPFSDGDWLRWNRTERAGCILTAELTRTAVRAVAQTPTTFSGDSVSLDAGGFAQRRIDRANRALQRDVTLGRYRREHLWVKTIKPAVNHLRWSRLRRLRLRQLRRALGRLAAAGRAE